MRLLIRSLILGGTLLATGCIVDPYYYDRPYGYYGGQASASITYRSGYGYGYYDHYGRWCPSPGYQRDRRQYHYRNDRGRRDYYRYGEHY